MDCWYLKHGLHLDLTVNGYRVSPCCQFRANENVSVPNPEDIHKHDILKNLKNDFDNGIKNSGCASCWTKEKLFNQSKRLDAPIKEKWQDIQVWDLRPGNTCNLKCVMCNPQLSTKWYEDIDVWKKYNDRNFSIDQIRTKQKFDWDYVKENTKNKALKIYIAGGEPFYMKEVINFLEYLSQFEFNCENTEIMVNTNGISYNNNMIKLLMKFKKIVLIVSIDGWEEVDELIRYPTVFAHKLKFIRQCMKFAEIRLNTTVSALNLLDLWVLQKQCHRYNIQFYKLDTPDFLSINSLNPKIIKKARNIYSKKHKNKNIVEMLSNYSYNENNAKRLKEYLIDLDSKRKTDSKKIIPWCFSE